MPRFFLHAVRSKNQIQCSPGFTCGCFARDDWRASWTITLWADEQSMKAFRNSGAHLKAMPRLAHWCDEGSYVHWEQQDATMPTADIIFDRLGEAGKLSRVNHPSAAHAGGKKTGKGPPVLLGAFVAEYSN